MLSINHVEAGGFESIRQARGTSFDPGYGVSSSGERQLVAYGVDGTEGHETFGNGIVYVMNENGKTVRKYDLDYAIPVQR